MWRRRGDISAMDAQIAQAGGGTVLAANLFDIGATPGYAPGAVGATESQLLTGGVIRQPGPASPA
ncbi:MAG: hypothetical protein WDM92_13470 [Caulobacteraceae bacterium]